METHTGQKYPNHIIPHTITDTGIDTKKTNNKTKQLRNRKTRRNKTHVTHQPPELPGHLCLHKVS